MPNKKICNIHLTDALVIMSDLAYNMPSDVKVFFIKCSYYTYLHMYYFIMQPADNRDPMDSWRSSLLLFSKVFSMQFLEPNNTDDSQLDLNGLKSR